MTVGDRIKELRIEKNMSLDDLAQKMGYKSRASIHRLEQGKGDITISVLFELSKALGVSPSYLLGESEDFENDAFVKKEKFLEIQKSFNKMSVLVNDLLGDLKGRDCFHDMRIAYKLEDEDVEIIKKLCERFLEKNDILNTSLKKYYPEIYYRNKNIEQEKKEPPQE